MKITFVLERADMSGGVRVVAELGKQLLGRGHDVAVFSTPYPMPSFTSKLKAMAGLRPWPSPGGKRPSHLDGSGVRHVVIDSCRPIVDADLPDADVVVATWWRTAEWVAALSPAKGAKAHLIQHYETWGGPVDRVDAVWRLPMHRIVISQWLADLARDKFNDRDVSLVPNGVDRNQFDASPRGKQPVPTVGMLYSTTPFKGTDLILAAIERTGKTIGNLKTIAFGMEPVAPHLPLPKGADYAQNPSQEKIAVIYANCDAWLCGSTSEGFYLPALEAMACRCPVVSTKVGFPLDAIEDGVNGYLVEVGDAAALADRLIKVLTLSDPQWRQMSSAAYATASRYTWQRACERLESAFVRAKEKQL